MTTDPSAPQQAGIRELIARTIKDGTLSFDPNSSETLYEFIAGRCITALASATEADAAMAVIRNALLAEIDRRIASGTNACNPLDPILLKAINTSRVQTLESFRAQVVAMLGEGA